MSVRNALLALVAQQPAGVYRLKQMFEEQTCGAWPLNIGQVYQTMQRLERDGQVVSHAETNAGRDSEVFELTDVGRDVLAAWWSTPVPREHPERDELVMKLAVAAADPTVDVEAMIQTQRRSTLSSLRDQVALVSQNVHLFNDTVANNIAYARTEEYSREQIEEAARMAYAMDFINKMDNGLDTVIGENGVLLSGGQRQRIAIARALLRDSPILILDEATSALDTESERAIQAALDELQKNRTSLVIAHRLSTIEKADEIVVVEDGVIVERGTHNDLLEHRGVYAQLHKMQFGQ